MAEKIDFIAIAAVVGEAARAKMLWHLLDGRAYTAGELALVAEVSTTSASNHLTKLLEADLLKVETQGRHRYYSFSRPEVAYAIEALAGIGAKNESIPKEVKGRSQGIKYCRTCYDHLAGNVGVKITAALEAAAIVSKTDDQQYLISADGWEWLERFGIPRGSLNHKKRPVARQCLDWSERKPHLAGQLGAILLQKMLELDWFRKVQFSRELVVTAKGQREIYGLLKVEV